jgi:hypothetical protein
MAPYQTGGAVSGKRKKETNMAKNKLRMMIGVAIMTTGTWLATTSAEAAGVKIGVLTCNVDGGWGYVLGSSKEIHCNYVPNEGRGEHYFGDISKIGVDIGYTSGGIIVWDVIAPTSDLRPGALEGGYGGVSAQATVGVGVGANVLLGGFDRSIALQPISIEGNTGLNVAAGIGAVTLKFDRG